MFRGRAPNPPYSVLSGLYPRKKYKSMLVGLLYNRCRAENVSIKWPVRVTPLKEPQSMLVGPLFIRFRAENASIKWPVWVRPLKESQSMSVKPFCTHSGVDKASIKWFVRVATLKKKSIDVGFTILYTSSPFHRFVIQSGIATFNPTFSRI